MWDKKKYVRSILDRAHDSHKSHDTRLFHQIRRGLSSAKSSSIGVVKNDRGDLCLSDRETAQAFEEHFARVLDGSLIQARELDSPPCLPVEALEGLAPIQTVLTKANPFSAPSLDGIDYSVLKKLPGFSRRVIEDVTSDVVSCNIPSHLNVMQLVPLHKKGSVNERTNFREVFLSSCIGKLCIARLRAPLLESLDTYFLSNMCGGVKK